MKPIFLAGASGERITRPESGSSTPASARKKVLLPTPLRPAITAHSPLAKETLRSSSTFFREKRNDRSRVSIMGWLMV